jgi:hypothetical protein
MEEAPMKFFNGRPVLLVCFLIFLSAIAPFIVFARFFYLAIMSLGN